MQKRDTNKKRHWDGLTAWVRRLFHVYTREFVLTVHDGGLLLFFVFLPFAYPVIYSLIYNPEVVREVPLIVVDHDRTPMSRKTVRMIDACEQAWVLGYATDLNEAREAMNNGECYAILEIPEGFERKIGRGETGNAVMFCEMSLLLRYKALLVATTNVMEEMGAELMAENINRVAPLAGTITDGNLLPIKNVSLGNIKSGFDSFIMPVVLMLILQQSLILIVGMAGGAKHENPKLVHYNPDNVTKSTLGTMLGQALCYITILFIPVIFMIHYVPMIFQFPMAGNLVEILAFLLPMVLASIGMGFVFQAVVTERESVFVSWVVTSLFFLLISGAIWPRYDLPAFWRGLGAIFPGTWGVEGYIKMNGNGSRLWQVSTEYLNLWILAVAWWFAGWCCQKWIVHPEVMRMQDIRESVTRSFADAEDAAPTDEQNEIQG